MDEKSKSWDDEIKKKEEAEDEEMKNHQILLMNALIVGSPKFLVKMWCLNGLLSNSSPKILNMSEDAKLAITESYANKLLKSLEDDNE